MNIIKLLQKVRLSMEIAKLQLDKKDMLKLQKGKHSVIDPDTSEPDDIHSVETETDSSEDELPYMFNFAE